MPPAVPINANRNNALKSALTGQTILIPADDVAAYQTLVQSLIDLHKPVSHEEQMLVQSLAGTEWQLRHIPILEYGIYALGRRELAGLHPECPDPQVRAALIEAEIYLKYQREFSNLSLQETRLLRTRQKDLARLRRMQAERRKAQQTSTPAGVGLEFSNPKPRSRPALELVRTKSNPGPEAQ